MIQCPVCNFENEDGALFCDQCKSDLGISPPVAAAVEGIAASAVPVPVAVLTPEPVVESTTIPVASVASVEIPPASILGSLDITTTDDVPFTVPADPGPAPGASEAEVGGNHETPATAEAVSNASASEATTLLPADEATPATVFKPRLVVVRGQRMNVEYALYEGDNYIGRADEKPVDVDLEDQEPTDKVWSSRQHAMIHVEAGAMTIEDLSSLNGTFVNRTRVKPGEKRSLQANDIIQIGTVQMRVLA